MSNKRINFFIIINSIYNAFISAKINGISNSPVAIKVRYICIGEGQDMRFAFFYFIFHPL